MENFSTDGEGANVADDAAVPKIWTLDDKRCFSLDILRQEKKKKSKHPGKEFPIIVDLRDPDHLLLIPNHSKYQLADIFGE